MSFMSRVVGNTIQLIAMLCLFCSACIGFTAIHSKKTTTETSTVSSISSDVAPVVTASTFGVERTLLKDEEGYEYPFKRIRTPNGWIVWYSSDALLFVPDPDHNWEIR